MKKNITIAVLMIAMLFALPSCNIFFSQGNTDATNAIGVIREDVLYGNWHARGNVMTLVGTVETEDGKTCTFNDTGFKIEDGQVSLSTVPESCSTDASFQEVEDLANAILSEKFMRSGLTKKTIETDGTFTIDGYIFNIRTKRIFDSNGFRDTTTELDLGQRARFLVTVPAGRTIDFKNTAYMKIFYDERKRSVSFDYESIIWDGHIIVSPTSPR